MDDNDKVLEDLKDEIVELKGILITVLAHMEEQCRCLNELYDYIDGPYDECTCEELNEPTEKIN